MNAVLQPLANLPVTVLSALALLGVVLGFFAVWLVIYKVVRLKAQYAGLLAQVEELEKNTRLLVSGSLGMGQRIMSLEAKLKALDERQSGIAVSEMDFSYSQAHTLIDQGVDSGTVAVNTGLSRSEIELMQLLHKTSKKPVYE